MQQPPNSYPQQMPPPQWQQQTNYTQPQFYYPPPPMTPQQQQWQQNKPQPPPTKVPTRRLSPRPAWQWILIGLIIGIFIGYAVHVPSSQSSTDSTTATTQDTPQATSQPTQVPTPTHTPNWTTVQTFSGNGNKKTAVFSVPDDWKIVWSCKDLTDGTNIDGVMYISVYGSDNSPIDPSAVSGTCTYGKTTSDSTEEHQSGNVYLDVNTGLPWTIQVQELK